MKIPALTSGSLRFALVAISCAVSLATRAENPVVQTNFTADPAPMVHNGILYLYTSHDEDDAPPGMGNFRMRDWKCYSTTDMVNWTDHGTIASLATFPWAEQSNDAWAPQVVERDGKFFLYVPISAKGNPKNVIAVATSDNPLGPFKDALGRPLVDRRNGFIDPTVFVDDDGQAYLYFGNPNLWYVKLNADMVSYSGETVQEPTKPDNYQEGPWFYKRNGHYYLAYASTCCPEGIGYAMSDSPTGPWNYKGYIMRPNQGSSGNHPGIVDYKGSTYVFGFNYKLNFALTGEHHERRSVCVAKFEYNADGSIPEQPWWQDAGVPQVGTLDPFKRVEAETICWSEGVKTLPNNAGGMCVRPARDGAYIKVKGVDFSRGASQFKASVLAQKAGAKLVLHLDRTDGPVIGGCVFPKTDETGKESVVLCAITQASGVHDLFLVFENVAAAQPRMDWWQFQ
jgi:hypothetical protein